MDQLTQAVIPCLATLVLLVGGARGTLAGPTLESGLDRPEPELLAVVDLLGLDQRPDHHAEFVRGRSPDRFEPILNQTLRDLAMNLQANENRFPPLYSRGLILVSLIKVESSPFDAPLNSQGLTLGAILNAVPTGHPSAGGLGLLLAGGAWNMVNASAGGSAGSGNGHPSLALDNRPPPFDMSRARESAVLFLALVCVLIPMILALLGLGERDRWILLSIKLLSLFVIFVFVCAYSYRNYHPGWHPIIEALMLINLAAGLGCLGAGACAREQVT